MALESDTIKRYLLGDAGEAERESIEMRINDEEFEQDIAIAESELIEEYLEGTLSGEDKQLFERHFLSSSEHRDLVNELSLLKRYSSGPAEAYLTGELRVPAEGLAQYRPLAAAATIVIVGLLGLLSWRMFQVEPRPPLEQKYVQLNAGDLSDLSHYPSMVLLREADVRPAREPKFRTDGPGTSFLFRLPVERAADAYEVSVSENGGDLFRMGGLTVYRGDNGDEVRLLLPRGMITPGRVSITLFPTGGGDALIYPFIAE